jgi:hypothetical protein
MACVPTIAEEDAKRPNHERECLVGERTRIVNRIKSALARLGIRNFKLDPSASEIASSRAAVLQVRIHLPPADSLSLSRSLFRRSRTRHSARVWGSWLDDQVGRDAQVFRYGAKPQQYLCRAIFQYRSVADLGGENARTKSGLLQA